MGEQLNAPAVERVEVTESDLELVKIVEETENGHKDGDYCPQGTSVHDRSCPLLHRKEFAHVRKGSGSTGSKTEEERKL